MSGAEGGDRGAWRAETREAARKIAKQPAVLASLMDAFSRGLSAA